MAGLALGRSATAWQAAVVEIAGKGGRMKPRLLAEARFPLAPEVADPWRQAVWAEGPALQAPAGRLVAGAAEALTQLARQAGVEVASVAAVGVLTAETAGREPALAAGVARATGLETVAGFAESDRAAGGQGGLLSAWPNWLLLRDRRLSRVVVHLGALAAVTLVGSGSEAVDLLAGDLGPGLAPVDRFMQRLHGRAFDADGAAASRGRVCPELLNELMGHHWLNQPLPKSARAADWSGTYDQRVELMARKHGCAGEDLIATLTELPARLVERAIGRMTERPHQVILTGGGAANITLASRIRQLLSPSSTIASDVLGWPAGSYDAACAAVLAAARLDNLAIYTPQATGADAPAVWGTRIGPGRSG